MTTPPFSRPRKPGRLGTDPDTRSPLAIRRAGIKAARVERLLYEARNTTYHIVDGVKYRVVDYTELLAAFKPEACGPLTRILMGLGAE